MRNPFAMWWAWLGRIEIRLRWRLRAKAEEYENWLEEGRGPYRG